MSVWPSITSVGYASSRWSDAITFGRPGSTSSKTTSHPIAPQNSPIRSATRASPPSGPPSAGLTLAIATSSDAICATLPRSASHAIRERMNYSTSSADRTAAASRRSAVTRTASSDSASAAYVPSYTERPEIEGRTKRGRRELRPMKVQRRSCERLERLLSVGQAQCVCSDIAKERVGHFSEGERRRVALNRSLIDGRYPACALPSGWMIDRTKTLASRTAVLTAVTSGADQIFRLRRVGWQSNTIGDLGESPRHLTFLSVARRPLLQSGYELRIQRAVVLASDLPQRCENSSSTSRM